MLQNLSEHIRECLWSADACAERAKREPNPTLQRDFVAMEQRWLKLAHSYQVLEQLGLFTAHNKQKGTDLLQRLEQRLLKENRFEVIGARDRKAPFNGLNDGRCRDVKFPLELHSAKITARAPLSIDLVEICATAEVKVLNYPVSAERQAPGQTMAVGTISRCLKRYGAATLITALQCVTQTTNNKPGALTARIIKALCALLAGDPALRDSGLALFERFDRIDLIALSNETPAEAAAQKIDVVQALLIRLRSELNAQTAGSLASDPDNRSGAALAVNVHVVSDP